MIQQKGIDQTSEISLLKKRNYELSANINETYINLVIFIILIRNSLRK